MKEEKRGGVSEKRHGTWAIECATCNDVLRIRKNYLILAQTGMEGGWRVLPKNASIDVWVSIFNPPCGAIGNLGQPHGANLPSRRCRHENFCEDPHGRGESGKVHLVISKTARGRVNDSEPDGFSKGKMPLQIHWHLLLGR